MGVGKLKKIQVQPSTVTLTLANGSIKIQMEWWMM